MRKHFPTGTFDPTEQYDLLRNTLVDHELGGVIWVRSFPGEGPPHKRFKAATILLPGSVEKPFLMIQAAREE